METPSAAGDAGPAAGALRPPAVARLLVALPSIAAALTYAWFAWWVPISLDAGVFLYTAQRILEHEAPYLASWDNKGPFLYLFEAAGLWLGGGSPRGAYLLEGGLLAASLWICTKLWAREAGAVAASWIAMMLVVSYVGWCDFGLRSETSLLPFQLAAYTAVAFGFGDPPNPAPAARFALLAGTGAVTSLALLTRPNDACGLLVVSAYLVRAGSPSRTSALLVLLAGAAAAAAPILAFLSLSGASGAFVDEYLRFNFHYSTATSLGSRVGGARHLLSELVQAPLWATLILVAGFGLSNRSRAAANVKLFSLVTLVDIASQMVSGRGYMQYWLVFLPSLAVLTVALCAQSGWRGRIRGTARAIACAVMAVAALGGVARAASEVAKAKQTGFSSRGSAHARAAAYIRSATTPEDRVLVLGFDIAPLPATGRRSPTRMAYLLPLLTADVRQRPAMARQYVSDLLRARPPLIVDDWQGGAACGVNNASPGWEREAALRGLCRWIRANYALESDIAGYRMWRLRRG